MTGATRAAILIVEDERIVAKDLQQSLRSMGHDAFAIASSANEALKQIEERRPDLVLMDIRIRGARDGIETAEVIRQQFGIPTIYLTAHADEATTERAQITSPYGYLVKPVKIPELRVAVELAAYKLAADKRERERERWLTATLECVPDPLLAVGVDGKVSFINAAAERVTNHTRADAVGFHLSDVLQVAECADGEVAGVEPADLERLRRSRSVFLRAAGRTREVILTKTDVVQGDASLGTLVVLRDVTDERIQTRQLEEAERRDAAKATIFGLANGLNNPLAVLACNASFAREEIELLRSDMEHGGPAVKGSAEARFALIANLAAQDRAAVMRIQKLFRDLRVLFDKPLEGAAGQSDLSLAVARAISATSERLRERARIETDLAVDLHVALESERLTTLLHNVTTNALEALAPSNASDQVIRVTSRSDAGRAIVEVTDAGEGIADADRGRVFEPFFTTRSTGHGLGLTVARRIADSAGGTLEIVSSRPGATTIRITVPLAAAPPRPSESAQ